MVNLVSTKSDLKSSKIFLFHSFQTQKSTLIILALSCEVSKS